MMIRKSSVICVIVMLVVALAATLAGCARQQESPALEPSPPSPRPASQTTIEQIGSTTVLPLAEKWREGFNKEHPSVQLAVSGGGSGTGIKALINGTADIANASRPIKDKEKQTAKDAGVKPVEHVVAYDGIAVIVHSSNPVSQLSVEQISDIFVANIKNWKEVGGADKEIVLINRDSSSGTYQVFKELVVQMDGTAIGREYAPEALALQSNQTVVESVANSETAIGYCGLGYIVPKVKPLSVAALGGGDAVAPSPQNVKDGSYPISRSLYMYTNGEPTGPLADYFDYIKGPGQQVVEELGFVDISE